MLDTKKLAKEIKKARIDMGWSQADLADASGVSLGSIARYEMGGTVPGFDAAVAMADALNVSVDVLAGR